MVLELQIDLFGRTEHVPAHLPIFFIFTNIQFGGRPTFFNSVDLLLDLEFVDRACVAPTPSRVDSRMIMKTASR